MFCRAYNSLKHSGICTTCFNSQQLYILVAQSTIYGFRMILIVNSVNQTIVVMDAYSVFFEVRTEFLNIV
jgi:hypothetical protein